VRRIDNEEIGLITESWIDIEKIFFYCVKKFTFLVDTDKFPI
jgi:hypothetical protein